MIVLLFPKNSLNEIGQRKLDGLLVYQKITPYDRQVILCKSENIFLKNLFTETKILENGMSNS